MKIKHLQETMSDWFKPRNRRKLRSLFNRRPQPQAEQLYLMPLREEEWRFRRSVSTPVRW